MKCTRLPCLYTHNTLMKKTLCIILLAANHLITFAAEPDYLQQCFNRQVATLNGSFAQFSYTMHEQQTYHSPEPWQVLHNYKTGSIWAGQSGFVLADTITRGIKKYITKELFTPDVLLVQPYWMGKPMDITEKDFVEEVLDIARYNPAMLIAKVKASTPLPDYSTGGYAMYTTRISNATVILYINRETSLLDKLTITRYDDMYGDITHTVNYSRFLSYKQYYYPRTIHYSKVNNITDTIQLTLKNTVASLPALLEKPQDYAIKKSKAETYGIVRHKVSKYIHALHLTQANSIATLVEFKDYFAVIDVPLGSINGELVQLEANKIAPGKPIKYYAFGHHHPWYLGGVRPFIHSGTTILTVPGNVPYIQYLANASHSLQPDSLHLKHTQVKTQLVDNTLELADGDYKMQLYHIGNKSDHTKDYIIFYFPKEKLLLQGDLLWAPADGSITPASSRAKGLYTAIQELGLKVDTILQAWPWGEDYKVKTSIPFSDLQQAVDMAKKE